MTCCFFASLKTLLIPTKATALRWNQRPRASLSLAGFQVTLIGRFWVTPEGRNRSWHPAIIQSSRLKSESCTRIHSPSSLSRTVAWNRVAFFQRRANLAALLSAPAR